MDFGSRTLRHLKLVSRLYPLKDRELYVEKHRANLLKLSLPSEILQIVERKEAIYRNFSASELIDLYISQTQILKSSSDEIYQVYSFRNFDNSQVSSLRTNKSERGGRFKKKQGNRNEKIQELKPIPQKVGQVIRQGKNKYIYFYQKYSSYFINHSFQIKYE